MLVLRTVAVWVLTISFLLTHLPTSVLSNSLAVHEFMEQKVSPVNVSEWPKPTKDCVLTNKGKSNCVARTSTYMSEKFVVN